jgi:ABC-type transport system substrate-binding protein
VTAQAVRFSVERALSPKLGSDTPAIRFVGDLVGARAFNEGDARRVTGIQVRGNTISFTVVRPSADFLERLSLPFFCTVPIGTPLVQGGVQPIAPPSAGPYFMSDKYNGEYLILEPNPNYRGPRPARLDAIAFREGFSPEAAVGRVEEGGWDGVVHFDRLLAPDGLVARRAASSGTRRHEVLEVDQTVFSGGGDLYALVSNRLGCDTEPGRLDLAALCLERE